MDSTAHDAVLCVDIGGTSTKLGVAGRDGSVEFLSSIPSAGPASDFGDSLAILIQTANHQAAQSGRVVKGLGVSVAGFLDEPREGLLYNSNLSWLENYPLKQRLAWDFNLPIELEVDSNAAALAEFHLGTGRGAPRFLCITVGTGLGVGLIVNGEPLRFSYGCLGDPGHIVIQPNGPLCPCGGRGCAELFVAAPLLAEEFRVLSGKAERCTLRDVIHAARAQDTTALAILQHAGEWLGIATASFANMFYPDVIAFAGGFAEAEELVLESIKESFNYSASKFAKDRVRLTKATLGGMSSLAGAAFPVWRLLDERSRLESL